MKKKVNIYPREPIFSLKIPIRSTIKNVYLSLEDIRKCLIANAKVEEILNDGSKVILTFNTYMKNFNETIEPKKEETIAAAPAPKPVEPEIVTEEKVEPPQEEEQQPTDEVTEAVVEVAEEEKIVETVDIEETKNKTDNMTSEDILRSYKNYKKNKKK